MAILIVIVAIYFLLSASIVDSHGPLAVVLASVYLFYQSSFLYLL